MTPVLTISEIHSQLAGEWILVQDPQTDSGNEIVSGHVLCHSKDRDVVYHQAVVLRPARFAVLFTGKIPQDTAIVLLA